MKYWVVMPRLELVLNQAGSPKFCILRILAEIQFEQDFEIIGG
jgi:hypothetical protein